MKYFGWLADKFKCNIGTKNKTSNLFLPRSALFSETRLCELSLLNKTKLNIHEYLKLFTVWNCKRVNWFMAGICCLLLNSTPALSVIGARGRDIVHKGFEQNNSLHFSKQFYPQLSPRRLLARAGYIAWLTVNRADDYYLPAAEYYLLSCQMGRVFLSKKKKR